MDLFSTTKKVAPQWTAITKNKSNTAISLNGPTHMHHKWPGFLGLNDEREKKKEKEKKKKKEKEKEKERK